MTHHSSVAVIPNPALNRHVTDAAFVLTLRKTHIGILQQLRDDANLTFDERLKNGRTYWDRFFIPAVRGLIDRGLVEHRTGQSGNYKLRDVYPITRAGMAVCELLVEAGLIPQALTNAKAAA